MNNASINLINSEKLNVRERNRILILRWISLVFLSFVALFSIVLFILEKRISINEIKGQQNAALQRISLLKDRNAKYNLLTDRLRIIKSLISIRKNYTVTLNAILSEIPNGLNVRSLTVDKEGILVSVSSNSLLPINEFLNRATSKLEKKVIKDMTIEGLTIDKQAGIYSLSIKAKSI